MKTLALATLIALAATQAKADHIENQTFNTILGSLAQAQRETVYQQNSPTQLSADQFNQLVKIASSQAEIWGDTILEGDYEADGKTQLDQVEALRTNTGELLAYRIQYSERSWDTSTCDLHASSDLSQCHEGRIEEATFVSPDLNSWIRDDRELAVFSHKR